MLTKIAALFLVAMAVLALFGRLRLPKRPPRQGKLESPVLCGTCGRLIIGKGDCDCGAPRKGKG